MAVNPRLFLPSGYLNWEYIYNLPTPFVIIVGGRGTGKTYGCLEYLLSHNLEFMFSRRTQKQIDLISVPDYSPFEDLNRDHGWSYSPFPNGKGTQAVYRYYVDDKGKRRPDGEPVAHLAALSTVANIRGFNNTAIKATVIDEFIRQPTEPRMKGEAESYPSLYETLNRNRELKGEPPMKFIALSNANEPCNPLFAVFEIMAVVEKMLRTGQVLRVMEQRGITVINLPTTEIGKKKADTALYRALGREHSVTKMAIDNDFNVDFSKYKSLPLREIKPLVRVGEVTIYKHKSQPLLYASSHASGKIPVFQATDRDVKKFKKLWRGILADMLIGDIIYESNFVENMLTEILHL